MHRPSRDVETCQERTGRFPPSYLVAGEGMPKLPPLAAIDGAWEGLSANVTLYDRAGITARLREYRVGNAEMVRRHTRTAANRAPALPIIDTISSAARRDDDSRHWGRVK